MRCDLANAWQTLGKPEARIVKMLANIVSYVKMHMFFYILTDKERLQVEAIIILE